MQFSPPRGLQLALPSSPPTGGPATKGAATAATLDTAAPGAMLDAEAWLRRLPDMVVQYASRFVRHGWGSVFAIGLMEDVDLEAMGIGPEHVAVISRYLMGPRNLVARWTPMLDMIPVTVTLQSWLRRQPVDLSHHAELLATHGFESVAVVKHLTEADAIDMGIPDGHARVLAHCVMAMADLGQRVPDPTSASLEDWLFHLKPSLDHYSRAIRLVGVRSVADLMLLTWRDVERIIMRRGHQRLLFHYIVAARAHWVDPV